MFEVISAILFIFLLYSMKDGAEADAKLRKLVRAHYFLKEVPEEYKKWA